MATPETSKPHAKAHINRYGLGPHAPNRDIPFPQSASLTAVELLTFLPNSIHSVDVVYRLISNGGSRHNIWNIINTNRDLPEVYSITRIGSDLYKSMRNAGYAGWTPTTHANWHDANKADWDETSLSVAGFRTPSQVDGQILTVPDIPFRDLANDIRAFPRGGDALDLTRMVQHCINGNEGQWMYPSDYDKLLQKLGGPTPIIERSLDRKAFSLWTNVVPPAPRVRTEEEQETEGTFKEPLNRRKRKRGGASSGPEHTPASPTDSAEFTPSVAQQHQGYGGLTGQKKDGRSRSILHTAAARSKGDRPPLRKYTRPMAQYIPPPSWPEAPSEEVVALALSSQAVNKKASLDSAYAFGGPRRQPPYRMLHTISQPADEDTSGWAENLRWALEQRLYFHKSYTRSWNESPEHMHAIMEARHTQVWVSEQLLAQLRDMAT